jgi:hypothetical protein
MANWALVENDKVKELHDNLPKNWKNFSGLRLSVNDTEFLNSLGWFPVTKKHEEFDRSSFRHIGYDYSIVEGKVIETYKLEEIPAEPEISKTNFIENLRSRRDELLKESDWTQLLDVQQTFDEHTKVKWQEYRQELRDLPSVYETSEHVNIDSIEWPLRY